MDMVKDKRGTEQRIRAQLKKQDVDLKKIYFISCKTGENVKDLVEHLFSKATKDLPKRTFPTYYMELHNAVKKEAKKKEIITYEEYQRLAFSINGVSLSSLPSVTGTLHDQGTLIYFGDNPFLRDIVVLSPQFLADRMSDLITFKVQFRSGMVEPKAIEKIWQKFDQKTREFLLSLLEKFEGEK